MKTTFEVAEHFTGDKIREGTLGDTGLWTQLLGITINPERKAAIDAGDPFASVCRYVVKLPPSLRFVQTPVTATAPIGLGSIQARRSSRIRPTPHRLEMEFDTRVTKTRVEPAEFEEFQAFQDSVQACFRATLKLKADRRPGRHAAAGNAPCQRRPSDAAAADVLGGPVRRPTEVRRRPAGAGKAAREAKPDVQATLGAERRRGRRADDEEELLRAMATADSRTSRSSACRWART